ncbi:MAG: hypothetical protein E7199_04735 [Schwartzia succinivorans]|nr:hypothetical protein [Schwartzia succinivorans]
MTRAVWRVVLPVFLLLIFAQKTYAGSFAVLADTGILQLRDNQAWEQSYKTDHGKFKIRFRKLWNASSEKKYHLIIWWDGKRIADGYSPDYNGYAIKIFQDLTTTRIFVALETRPRTVLMGYDPVANRLEKYADSKEYYSPRNNPRFLVDGDRDLLLSFVGNGYGYPTNYKLFWDAKRNWFGYQDVTVRPVEEEYEPPQEDYAQEEAQVDTQYVTTGELYYEEETVVGS